MIGDRRMTTDGRSISDKCREAKKNLIMHEETIEADTAIANERGFLFGVMRKEKRHGSWTEVFVDIQDLQTAMTMASAVQAYEVGVFLGGKIYWTSRCPDVFNSIVIQLPLSAFSPPLKIKPSF